MSFNTVVPNAGQSPGIFPTQSNTNFSRLQALISGDHQFNNSAAQNDGKHKQVTYIDRVDPVAPLPTGTNIISFSKQVFDTISDLYTFNGNHIDPQSWRELSGTVALVNTGTVLMATVPTNCYGDIWMLIRNNAGTPFISKSFFISNDTTTTVYSTVINQYAGNFAAIPNVVFPTPASLDLYAQTTAASRNGTWTYKIQYRKYA